MNDYCTQDSPSLYHSLTLSKALAGDTGHWWMSAPRASSPQTACVMAESPPSGPGCTRHTPALGASHSKSVGPQARVGGRESLSSQLELDQSPQVLGYSGIGAGVGCCQRQGQEPLGDSSPALLISSDSTAPELTVKSETCWSFTLSLACLPRRPGVNGYWQCRQAGQAGC